MLSEKPYVAFAITAENAQELRLFLLERPHNEQWSNDVLDAVEAALDRVDNVVPIHGGHSVRVGAQLKGDVNGN